MTKHQRRGKFAYLKATNSLSLGLAVPHAQNQVAVRCAVLMRVMEAFSVSSNWRMLRSRKVNGTPMRLSLPKDLSGYDTPARRQTARR